MKLSRPISCRLRVMPDFVSIKSIKSSSFSLQCRSFSGLRIPTLYQNTSNEIKLSCYYSSCIKKTAYVSNFGTMSDLNSPPEPSLMRISDYDCVGFDLDNTLCEYNILSTVEMEYNLLAKFLVNKGYDPSYLLKPLDKSSIDFLQKGLLLDFTRGNVLKLGENGSICKASHGTKFMTDKEIIETYGHEKKWEVSSIFCEDMLNAWNGPLSERVRALLDYFDMPASLIFGRIVDSIDYKLGNPAESYNVWPDVLAGLQSIYNREKFSGTNESYFQDFKANPLKFIKKCSPATLEWLKQIKQNKITFLVTGSNSDFASLTAETCLGKDWKDLFDVVVFYARKPGFFTGCRPFITLDGFKETDPIRECDLALGNMYSQGNWQELYQFFGRKLNKKEPSCLYFGDNLIQDVFTPSEYTKCDTVAVVEELIVENNNISEKHPSEVILLSESWGSYFFDENEQINTFWGRTIKNYSKLCVPGLSVFTKYPLTHTFKTFKAGPKEGYFPGNPSVIEMEKSTIPV